jgi:cytoskeletal protein CcmA (bactofilin family)
MIFMISLQKRCFSYLTPVSVFVMLIATLMVLPQNTDATVVRGGDVYTFERDAVIDRDAYFVGKELYLKGTVQGDLFAAGARVEIDGVTDDDVLVLAGNATVGGDAGGDLRIAGGEIVIAGTYAEDVVVLGGTVRFTADSFVGENVLVYADVLLLEGTIDGSVEAHARSVLLQGTINGSANIEARESFSMTRDATIAGDLTYRAPRELFLSDTASIGGEIEFSKIAAREGGFGATGLMIRIIMAVVAGVLLMILFPAFTRSASQRALSDNGLIALKGLALLFFVPLFAIMLLPTIFGILPAVIILTGYLFWILVAMALTPIIAGVLLARALKREDGQFWAWASLGAIVLNLVTMVGFLGFLLAFLIFLVAFGTIGSLLYHSLWKNRKVSEVADTESQDVTPTPEEPVNEENAESPETKEKQEEEKNERS